MLSKFSEPMVLHHYTLFTVELSTFTAHAQPVKQKVHETLVVFVKRSEIILGNEQLYISEILYYAIFVCFPERGKETFIKAVNIGQSLMFSSVTQLCLTLCSPMDCSTPGFSVHCQLLELTKTHVHRVGDVIQPSHPLILNLLKTTLCIILSLTLRVSYQTLFVAHKIVFLPFFLPNKIHVLS